MRKLILILASLAVLSSCGITSNTTPEEMYNWGKRSDGITEYEKLTYQDYKTRTPEAMCNLLCYYENLVTNPTGTRKLPPPGICAEYGYLLLLSDTATVFAEKATNEQKLVLQGIDFRTHGLEMLQMELESYPESRPYIMPMLKKASESK